MHITHIALSIGEMLSDETIEAIGAEMPRNLPKPD